MNRRVVVAVIVVGLLILIAGFGYASYVAHGVNPSHKAPGVATACGTTIPTAGLRNFQVVPDQTTASYSVHEDLVLRNLPDNVAVGKTHAVQGMFDIRSGASPAVANMTIKVDLRTLQTDSDRRDHYVRQNYLQSDTYPYAVFVSTCAQGLPANAQDGQMIPFQITGNLALHGKTNKEIFDVHGKLAGNMITGTATTTIYMTDFDIEPPNLANIAIAQNKVLLTIAFAAKEG